MWVVVWCFFKYFDSISINGLINNSIGSLLQSKLFVNLPVSSMIYDIKERLQERMEYYGDDENLESKIYHQLTS